MFYLGFKTLELKINKLGLLNVTFQNYLNIECLFIFIECLFILNKLQSNGGSFLNPEHVTLFNIDVISKE